MYPPRAFRLIVSVTISQTQAAMPVGLRVQEVLSSDAQASPECSSVTDPAETHYARSADGTNIAYQVSGYSQRPSLGHDHAQ